MSVAGHDKWTLEEKIRLLELYINKDSGVWEDRANALQEEFAGKRPADFFTQITVRREMNNIFNKPNPEHHVFGLPIHARGKEAAELWLKHFRNELEEGRERRKQMFMVAMRKQLDLIRRYQQGKLPKEELDALLEEARERDAQRPDKEQYEAKIKQHMSKAYFGDVRSFTDYFRFLRGVRIPTPARSPTPAKMVEDESTSKIIVDSMQDAKEVRKTVAGQSEPTSTSTAQQRMPRVQVAVTPLVQKPNTRKRRHEVSEDIDAELDRPSEKRLRRSSKTVADGNDATFTLEAVTSLCISLDKSKEHPPLDGESEARINMRSLAEFEFAGLRTRVPKYAEANEKYLLTKSGPEEFKERIFPICRIKCIENGIPIIAKGREKEFDAKEAGKTVAGQPEPTDISVKQQRMPRMQIAATPPSETPNTRKRKIDLSSGESRDTSAGSNKLREKRTRLSIKKDPADDASSSSALSSPMSFVATPPQTLISEVAATAKLRSQLRRAAIASATPSPAVDSIADNRLFLKPGKLSSTEVVPKQILLTLWRDIHSHRYASVFSFPVSEELVHGYHTAIKKPMDLKTLKTSIESGEVNTLGQFSRAILKMFANAVMYNSTGHYVNNYAKEMAAYALKCIEVVQFPGGQFQVPPPSRQSNGSSSEGGAKFSIAWATTLIKPKGVTMGQKSVKSRNDEEKSSMCSSQEIKEEELTKCNEGEARRLFKRRRLPNKKYVFPSIICSNLG